MNPGRKWLVDCNTGKTQLVSFDRNYNTGVIDVKMGESALEKKSSFKMLGSYVISIAKNADKKIGALIHSLKFISPAIALYLYINLPNTHAWNTAVMSALVLLVATWNCWISYKNGYAGLLALHLLPFMSPWVIVKL